MGGSRALKGTIGGIAALKGAAAFALWYQLFRRPLPRTMGGLRVRGLDAPVDLVRDRFGVPHITARSAVDLCFGLGFCHGQDRLWQLEFFRRATAGRLSEFAGAATLKADVLTRTLGFRRVAEREQGQIVGELRDYLGAYAAGINGAIETSRALPLEFQLTRLRPEPWTVVDLLSASKLLAFGLSTNWELELLRSELVELIGAEKTAALEPQYPRGNPLVTAPGRGYTGEGNDLAAQIASVREALGLSAHATGSNNWVVSGERSVTGKPLLACDPHLTTTIPDLWYEADLTCDDYRVRGATLPTSPFPVYGQTRHTAWGFTNVMADTQDLFVERLNPDDPGLYRFEGEWRRAELVREEIRVKDRSQPKVVEVTVTHHGPIVNVPLGAEGEPPVALTWTGLEHPCITLAGHRSGLARDGEELVGACSEHNVPALNMLWADAAGNIGYQLIGKVPVRKGGAPDLAKPGWSGEFEWTGTIPYDELPRAVNPPEGFIVTANNRIVDDHYPHHITSEWMTGYRAQRIEEMLTERERHSLQDFQRMQLDFYSYPGVETVHRLSRLHPRTQRETRAIERLKSWDGNLDADTIAGTIYQAFQLELANTIVRAAIPDAALAARYLNESALALFEVVSSPWRFQERLLELWDEGDPAWWASEEHPDGRPWDEVALEALARALDGLERRFGRDPGGWRWGDVHGVAFQHPFGSGNAILRRIFNRYVRAGGASETVTQTGYLPMRPYQGVWGPVYRMLADVGEPRNSRWQITTGQSGQPGSRHYDDMLDGWLEGTTNPVYTDEHEIRSAGRARHLRLDPD
jgi:penicillin amidase